MFNILIFRIKKLVLKGLDLAGRVISCVLNFTLIHEAKSISLARQRHALATTVEYVERHMRHVDSVGSKLDLLKQALEKADTSGDRLVCEFGVFMGQTINFLSRLTPKTVFGFDSFEGLPERWRDTIGKGLFAVPKLPGVRRNVTLIKGLFHETLPTFLKEHHGSIGFLHVDCDLYSSAKVVFEFLELRLKPGAVIVFDEYFNYPEWEEGEYKAFMEFLAKTGFSFEFIGYHRNAEQVAVILKEGGPSPA